MTLADGAESDVAGALGAKLTEVTGERWIVVVSDGGDGADPARGLRGRAGAAEGRSFRGDPLVKALLASFPDAEIGEVRVNREDDGRKARGE